MTRSAAAQRGPNFFGDNGEASTWGAASAIYLSYNRVKTSILPKQKRLNCNTFSIQIEYKKLASIKVTLIQNYESQSHRGAR